MFQPGSVEPHSSLGHHHHAHEEPHSHRGSSGAHLDRSHAGRSLKAGKFDRKGSSPHHGHHASSAAASAGAPSSEADPPTGELCGSVFWTFFNQRFHRLFPDNETFVFEMERSIINVGLSALGYPGSGGQGPNGTGIRYFFNQVGGWGAGARDVAGAGCESAGLPATHPAPLCFSLRVQAPPAAQAVAEPEHALVLLRGAGHAPLRQPRRVRLHARTRPRSRIRRLCRSRCCCLLQAASRVAAHRDACRLRGLGRLRRPLRCEQRLLRGAGRHRVARTGHGVAL